MAGVNGSTRLAWVHLSLLLGKWLPSLRFCFLHRKNRDRSPPHRRVCVCTHVRTWAHGGGGGANKGWKVPDPTLDSQQASITRKFSPLSLSSSGDKCDSLGQSLAPDHLPCTGAQRPPIRQRRSHPGPAPAWPWPHQQLCLCSSHHTKGKGAAEASFSA